MKKLVTIAAVAAFLFTANSVHAKRIANAGPSIDTIIEQRMSEAGIVGLGAAVIVNGELAWSKGYGFADKGNGVPFSPRTIMNIGSISKTVTGVAMMRAVQDGKLSLDEDINIYLPFKVTNPNFPIERITLRQLATHTSSITDQWSVYEAAYHYGGDSPIPLGEFLEDYFSVDGKHYSKENFLDARPGTYREYSNIAAALAGYIVELAVGEPLNVYTRRHIFEPLQMTSTGWFLSEISRAKHSKLYVTQDGMAMPIELYGLPTYPDGGVRTSVAELSTFLMALLNEGEHEGVRILERQSVGEMLRFQYTDANRPENINLGEKNSGLFWSTKMNVTRIGHGGTDPGVKTEMLCDLSGEVCVIMFGNTSLSGDEMRHYAFIFSDLWNHALKLKDGLQQAATGR